MAVSLQSLNASIMLSPCFCVPVNRTPMKSASEEHLRTRLASQWAFPIEKRSWLTYPLTHLISYFTLCVFVKVFFATFVFFFSMGVSGDGHCVEPAALPGCSVCEFYGVFSGNGDGDEPTVLRGHAEQCCGYIRKG